MESSISDVDMKEDEVQPVSGRAPQLPANASAR